MTFQVKNKKLKEKKQTHNPYFVDGKDISKEPIYLLEEGEDSGLTPAQFKALWQYGVDSGIVWRLQGWYGRTAQDLLDSGYIHYPTKHKQVGIGLNSATDYYGNPIPTEKEAKQGHFD